MPDTQGRTSVPVLHVPRGAIMLPDNDQWTNRFQIHSESSSRVYIISQHKARRHWGCSCPAWRTRRYCKHLSAVGVPAHEIPHEVQIEGKRAA